MAMAIAQCVRKDAGGKRFRTADADLYTADTLVP
jgi:hypothetical protein